MRKPQQKWSVVESGFEPILSTVTWQHVESSPMYRSQLAQATLLLPILSSRESNQGSQISPSFHPLSTAATTLEHATSFMWPDLPTTANESSKEKTLLWLETSDNLTHCVQMPMLAFNTFNSLALLLWAFAFAVPSSWNALPPPPFAKSPLSLLRKPSPLPSVVCPQSSMSPCCFLFTPSPRIQPTKASDKYELKNLQEDGLDQHPELSGEKWIIAANLYIVFITWHTQF